MNAVGIIAEYNPFHNGHLYHLLKTKELFPDDVLIVILSGNFMQRGETSVINKWDKANIVLNYGADIVVELPFPFATQSADFFAKGSIQLLDALHVNNLVFGSESNDIESLIELANIQLESNKYKNLVKSYLKDGTSYPASLSKALFMASGKSTTTPNDILGVSYIKEIIRQKSNITPFCIKRTNDYHNAKLENEITSATSIRKSLKNNGDLKKYVPLETYNKLNSNLSFIEDYYQYLKYQIIINIDSLDKFQTVDEGIENRIKKHILNSNTLEELIMNIKTKRYTYNRIRRMLTHIMCNFTKEEAKNFTNIEYVRILGFNKKGQAYLNQIKKNIKIPLLTNFSREKNNMLDLEFRTTCVYASIFNDDVKKDLIEHEYKNNPQKNRK